MAFCAFSHPPLPLVQDSRTRWLRARRCPGEDRDVSLSHRARRQWDEITQATNTLAPSRRFFQTSKPHEGFHWGLPREAELPAETQPGERGASIWQFGQVPASCRRGGVCAPLAQRPALRFGASLCGHHWGLQPPRAPENRSPKKQEQRGFSLCVRVCAQSGVQMLVQGAHVRVLGYRVCVHTCMRVLVRGVCKRLCSAQINVRVCTGGCKHLCNVHV